MFISKLTVQISSLYFMIILFTNTLLCVEIVEIVENEPVNNNNVNDDNAAQPANYSWLSPFRLVNSGLACITSFCRRKAKEATAFVENQISKPKPVVKRNHDPTKRVQEPIIENRDNGLFLVEGLIIYFLEFFCQNNYYIQDTDTELIQKLSEKMKLLDIRKRNEREKNASGNTTTANNNTANNSTANGTTGNNNADNNTTSANATATTNDITDNNTITDNTISSNDKSDADLQKVFPSGVHLLTEKCFENGFLKCKDSDHTKEIFDLIFKDDEQIANLISVDEKILKNVINYKKKYTILENNKIVEFLKLLDKNKPNDTYDRLEKSNKNGYNLIYPKCNSSISVMVCLLKGVIEKIKMNYEENEKRNKKDLNGKSVVQKIFHKIPWLEKIFGKNVSENSVAGQENVGQNVTENSVARQESAGQNVTEQESVGQNVSENSLAIQENAEQNVTENSVVRQENVGQNVTENSVARQESVWQNMFQRIPWLGKLFGKNVTENSVARQENVEQNVTEQALANNQEIPLDNNDYIPLRELEID